MQPAALSIPHAPQLKKYVSVIPSPFFLVNRDPVPALEVKYFVHTLLLLVNVFDKLDIFQPRKHTVVKLVEQFVLSLL